MKRLPIAITDLIILISAPIIFLFIKGKRTKGVLALLVILVMFSGCFKNYYKVVSQTSSDSVTLSALKNSDKYFVIHLKNGFYGLKNITANGNTLEGELQPLPHEREKFVFASQAPGKTYTSRDKATLFSEIHLYAQEETSKDSGRFSIPLSSVTKINIYEKDTGKTIGSYVLGALGIYLGINLLAAIIVLAMCNCPQVYTYDGNQYNFKSGVFSGAIYSSIEKTDYLPLEGLISINGKYIFKLANNQKEEQFINQVQLVNVEHDADVKVLLDRKGNPYTYTSTLVLPEAETKTKEVVNMLRYKDGVTYMFNEQQDEKSPYASVILNFPNTGNSNDGKLIIHAKNSLWSGYVFDEFSSMFGSNYQSWTSKQDKAKREVIEKWQQDQALPLMVYVETNEGWSFVGYFPFTGNTASRDMIMKLPLPENKKKVRVKIESAYMFWELDYTAMDFSKDEPVKVNYSNPSIATTNSTDSRLAQITSKDKEYVSLKEEEALRVEFDAPPVLENKSTSVFLLTAGYYHNLKEYTGKTQTAALYKFRRKGAFNQFSKAKYNHAREVLAKGINFKSESNN
jgi:hypothetical protein